jgi:alpha-tubulin suppressor-like RCC1 family protein
MFQILYRFLLVLPIHYFYLMMVGCVLLEEMMYLYFNYKDGRLGFKTIPNNNQFPLENYPKVLNVFDIVQISGGGDFSLILDKLGNVSSFGSNNVGQLGIGNDTIRESSIPIKIPTLSNIIKVRARGLSGYVLTDSGFVKVFGLNYVKIK